MNTLTKIISVFTSQVKDDSPKLSVNSTDIAKLARNSLIVGVSAGLAAFSEGLTGVNVGAIIHDYLPILSAEQANLTVVPVIFLGIDFVIKFFKNNKSEVKA